MSTLDTTYRISNCAHMEPQKGLAIYSFVLMKGSQKLSIVEELTNRQRNGQKQKKRSSNLHSSPTEYTKCQNSHEILGLSPNQHKQLADMDML